MASNKEAKILDVFLGNKLRNFREHVEWTLHDLGERVGVSHQQIHKYEKAQTKISASMLYKFSQLFGVNVEAFFEGLNKGQ
jgi:transcriptional regulator with XRE-family HTH domain